MIAFENVSKRFRAPGGETWVARDLSFRLDGAEPVALLGRNGAGKSTLLRLIAGSAEPDAGRILRRGRVSWPVGFAGSFHGDLTGAENTRFVARLYGVQADALVAFVEGFSGLGDALARPVRTYSAGMRARLAFAVSMGVPFDLYLIDEVTSVGDAAFRARSEAALAARLEWAGAVVVSHSLQLLARLCRSGAVLEDGRLTWHGDVMDAIAHHRALMGVAA